MTGHVLILGAQGRFGRHTAEAFWNAGWRVRIFDRKTDDLMEAAQGMDVIVHGWNPAYPDWADQLPQQTDAIIRAAQSSGATVLLAGNLYVFGEAALEVLGTDTSHAALNPLGRLRVEMERRFRDSGVPLIVLRAGDFLDTEASGNWFDRIIAAGLSKGRLTYPGNPTVPHAWAFLPDLGRAAVQLAAKRSTLPRVADVPFPGLTLTGDQLAALCEAALGRKVTVKRMNWLPIQLSRPIWRLAAPLLEMRYLWNKPHRISQAPFEQILPGFSMTSPQDAIARAVAPLVTGGPDQPTAGDAAPRPALAG